MAIHKIAGYLMMLKGNLKRNIGKLTHNHYCVMSGEKDLIISKIQLQYGLSFNEAEIASTWNIPTQ